jgi:hypothetical protein
MGCLSSRQSALETVDDSVHVMISRDKKTHQKQGDAPRGYVPRAPHPLLQPTTPSSDGGPPKPIIAAEEEEDDNDNKHGPAAHAEAVDKPESTGTANTNSTFQSQ